MEISINEETFHIHQETAQLELIKDVRDELNMIMMVLTDQKKALEEIKTADLSKRGFSSDLFQIIHQHEYELTRLDERAEKVYIAVSCDEIVIKMTNKSQSFLGRSLKISWI